MDNIKKFISKNKIIYLTGVESLFFIEVLDDLFDISQAPYTCIDKHIYLTKGKRDGVLSLKDHHPLKEGWIENTDSYLVFKKNMPVGFTLVILPALKFNGIFTKNLKHNILGTIILKSGSSTIFERNIEKDIYHKSTKVVTLSKKENKIFCDNSKETVKSYLDLVSIFRVDELKKIYKIKEKALIQDKLKLIYSNFDDFFFSVFEEKILNRRKIDFYSQEMVSKLVEHFNISNSTILVNTINNKTENFQKNNWKLSKLKSTLKKEIINHVEHN